MSISDVHAELGGFCIVLSFLDAEVGDFCTNSAPCHAEHEDFGLHLSATIADNGGFRIEPEGWDEETGPICNEISDVDAEPDTRRIGNR